LSVRLKDQSNLVREIADKAEDVVWRRLKRANWIVAALVASLALWGFKSIDDAGNKIVETGRQRVEPLIQAAELRAKAAQEQIAKAADRATEIDKTISGLDARLSTALGRVESIRTSGDVVLKEISQLRDKLNLQQKSLNETAARVTDLQGKVVDLGQRELRAEKITTTGLGPSNVAFGNLGCPPFVMSPAIQCREMVGGAVAGGGKQPRRQDGTAADGLGPPRQRDEHRLRHILGQVRIAHLPPRRGVDELDMPLNEQRKRPLRAVGDEVLK